MHNPLLGTLTHAWQVMHPPRQPWDRGWLDVGDGHEIAFEQCGHPGAPVALVLHGGPGACSAPDDRRWFDPRQWRVVLADQRGCGRSRAVDPLHANTTAHLVADLEALRRHLGVAQWLLLGGSWGSTLALAYAQAHPQHVTGLVLRGVFLGTAAEGRALFGSLADDLHDALQRDNDPAHTAARAWWQCEQDHMAHEGPARPALSDRTQRSAAGLRSARIGVHYARANWFLRDAELLQGASRLRGIPGVILQGLADRVTPPAAARALHAVWPAAQLVQVAGAGHAAQHPALAAALVDHIQALAQTAHPSHPEETPHGCRETCP